MEYDKKFLIIGNINSVGCRDIFPLFMQNKCWLGASIHSGDRVFNVPDSYPLEAAGCGIDKNGKRYIRVKGVRWYTNIDYEQRHEDLVLFRHYDPAVYPKYDNYDAIEVSKVCDIPCDYDGYMGVPITFLNKFNPQQFEIVGKSGDINWAESNACDFFTPPEESVRQEYKQKYRDWRVQHPYFLDKNGVPKTIYTRIFIRNKHLQNRQETL